LAPALPKLGTPLPVDIVAFSLALKPCLVGCHVKVNSSEYLEKWEEIKFLRTTHNMDPEFE
jgi:hypothetical protein